MSGARIYRIAGPPGTGKTTSLTRQSARAAEQHGPLGVVVCSLTRAAAREAAGRLEQAIRVGTLHSICYGMLGRPDVIRPADLDGWNAEHPEWSMTGRTIDREAGAALPEDGRTDARGDTLHETLGLYLHRMTAWELWPEHLRGFRSEWERYKEEIGKVDFDDMITHAADELPLPPREARVMLVDEAQDLSRLEVSLLARWSTHLDTTVFYGDQDQALFSWRGACRESMAAPYHTVLSQSYRVPRAVWRVSTAITRAMEHHDDAPYQPTDQAGEVVRLSDQIRLPEPLVPRIEEAIAAEQSIMVLASCGYMLGPLLAVLRKAAIPYHNPYCGRWSPLRLTGGTARAVLDVAAAAREDGIYTARGLKAVATMLRAEGVFARGGKREIAELEDDAPPGAVLELCRRVILREAVEPLCLAADWQWLLDHCLPPRRRALEYATRVYERWGEIRPRLVVGTVHSVKGGEADVVIVAPDLSPSGVSQYHRSGWEYRDAIHRLFYVAATRARSRLVLLSPSNGGRAGYPWPADEAREGA